MNESSAYDPMVEDVLDDRYGILVEFTRGGIAAVYRARDRHLQRTVTVRIMRTDPGEDDEFAMKFDREACSAAPINHPTMVSIFNQSISRGQPYIVMEFIDGEALRRLIAHDAPLEPVLALDYLEPIASALAATHDAGVVHRDIKPGNAMVSTRDHVKVADFDLARQTESPQVAATEVLVDTVLYLPPELVTHTRLDSCSGIYSTGIVLFELLTGKKLHVGENNYQIAYAHVNIDAPAPSTKLRRLGFSGFISDYLDALVAACTTRDPKARVADGRELMDRLRRVRTELASNPGQHSPVLAAQLRPLPGDSDATTRQISPRPEPRPRPLKELPPIPVRPRSTETPDPAVEEVSPGAVTTVVQPQSLRSPASAPSPRSAISARLASSAGEPPRTTFPGPGRSGSPNSHCASVFPQFSQNPIYQRRRGIMLFILVLTVMAIVVSVSWWWAGGRFTTTPGVINIPQEQALQALRTNGLEYTTQEAFSEDVAVGSVISTDPVGDARTLQGTKVAVTVSRSPERYAMPEVVGQELSRARSAIGSTNLTVGQVKGDQLKSVEASLVVSAGASTEDLLPPGAKVDLVASRDRQPITIEDYKGTDAGQADRELKKQGFTVKVPEERSDTVVAGQVISQDPASSTGYHGDTVKLVKSLSPEVMVMPSVARKHIDETQKELKGAGFKAEVQNNSIFPAPPGFASGTNSSADLTAPKDSTAILYVT